jgi:hypothetical protein
MKDLYITRIMKEQQEIAATTTKKETFREKIKRYGRTIRSKALKLIDYLIDKMESAQKFQSMNKKLLILIL